MTVFTFYAIIYFPHVQKENALNPRIKTSSRLKWSIYSLITIYFKKDKCSVLPPICPKFSSIFLSYETAKVQASPQLKGDAGD